MKKIVTLLLISLAVFGCKKGDTAPKEESIVGTIWVGNMFVSDGLRAIEFTSDTNVKCYATDEYLGEQYSRNGTYTRNGNELKFNLEIYYMLQPYNVVSGSISGDFLSIHIEKKDGTSKYDYRLQRKK